MTGGRNWDCTSTTKQRTQRESVKRKTYWTAYAIDRDQRHQFRDHAQKVRVHQRNVTGVNRAVDHDQDREDEVGLDHHPPITDATVEQQLHIPVEPKDEETAIRSEVQKDVAIDRIVVLRHLAFCMYSRTYRIFDPNL